MAEWQFPNAIAESVRRSAALRWQTANRIYLRDPDDKWPEFIRVSGKQRCPGSAGLRIHEGSRVLQGQREYWDPFCAWCGHLIRTG